MLPCDRLTPLPPRAPARPPKAPAAARIDWSIQDLPHKMATSPLEKASPYLIALYKEGIASKDAVITQLRAERHTLEAQIKSANGMETLLQNELEAAIRVQNDLKEKLTTSLQAAKEKLTAAEAAYGKKVDHLSEAMHALTLAQMDLQASQRERRNVETINTSLSNELSSAKKELAAKDGDILALKEALRIAQRAVDREAQRAVDEVNAPTLQKRLEDTEKELKSVRAALRSAQKAPPTPEYTDWCLCNGTGQYVKRRWGDGWVSEVTTPCPAPKHYPDNSRCLCNGTGKYTKRCRVDTQQGAGWLHEVDVPCTACKHTKAPTACLSADQIRQQRSTNGAGLCACPYVCSVHTKTPGQQTDAMGIPTHNPDGSELSRNKRKAYEAAHSAQEPALQRFASVLRRNPNLREQVRTEEVARARAVVQGAVPAPAPEPSKKPVPAPAQVLPRAHVAGDLLKTILQDTKSDPPTGYNTSVNVGTLSAPMETYKKPAEPKVDDDDIDTLLDSMLNSKETSTDDVLPALLKALDVVGKKAFSEEPERAQELLTSILKDDACNVQ